MSSPHVLTIKSDPGIAINIHKQAAGYSYDRPESYIVPGPKVWSG